MSLLGLIFSIFMYNFAAIWSAVLEERTFDVAIFDHFPDIRKLKFSLFTSAIAYGQPEITLLSSTSCTFCKCKTRCRVETQFLIELAALYTLANHNGINSDDTLPFIIFVTPVSCDSSNRLWRQRLLLSQCSLWRHKKFYWASFDRWPAENAKYFAESFNDIVFIDISVFTACFAFVFFVYCRTPHCIKMFYIWFQN